jgi:hypothetical protein
MYSMMKYQDRKFKVDLPGSGGMALSQYYNGPESVDLFRKNIAIKK